MWNNCSCTIACHEKNSAPLSENSASAYLTPERLMLQEAARDFAMNEIQLKIISDRLLGREQA